MLAILGAVALYTQPQYNDKYSLDLKVIDSSKGSSWIVGAGHARIYVDFPSHCP